MDELADAGIHIDKGATKSDLAARIEAALMCAVRYGGIDGDDHKTWVIDQMMRYLTGCPLETQEATDCRGNPYSYEGQGKSKLYSDLIVWACDGEDGPDTYDWDVGCPP
jgi:hypothetical protein